MSVNIDKLLRLKDKKNYVDWYDIHKKNMKAREGLKGKQREYIIRGYVERVDLTYDKKFKYNIVRDNAFMVDGNLKIKKVDGKTTTRLLIKKKERIKFRDLENANFN